MASASPLVSDIDQQLLQCTRCSNWLKEPRLLPCLHKFCRECLKKIVKDGDRKLKCPTCRVQHDLPENGVDGLKTDHNSKDLIEFIQLQNSVKYEPFKICIHCTSKLEAAAFCFKCHDFLCQKCHEHHTTNRSMTEHKPHIFSLKEADLKKLTIEDLSSLRESPKCNDHPEKLSDLCCTTCGNQPICITCIYGAHQGHNLKDVKLLAEIEREKLTKKVECLVQVKDRFDKMKEETSDSSKRNSQSIDEKKQKLRIQVITEKNNSKKAISGMDEQLLKIRNELDGKNGMSPRRQKLEKGMVQAKEEYEKVCVEEGHAIDAEMKKLQEESAKKKSKLQEGLDNIRKKREQLATEETNLKRAIKHVDEDLKKRKSELERKKTTSAKIQKAEKGITQASEEYNKVCREEKLKAEAQLKKRQDEIQTEKKKIQERLDNTNRKILEMLTSLETKKKENTDDFEEVSAHFDDITKRLENTLATSSSVLATKHHWTNIQCIPDVSEAMDALIRDLRSEIRKSNISLGISNVTRPIRELNLVRERRVEISENYSVFHLRGISTITGLAGSNDGNIVTIGCKFLPNHSAIPSRTRWPGVRARPLSFFSLSQSVISVYDMGGDLLKEYTTNDSLSFVDCDWLSEFEVVTLRLPDEIILCDTREGIKSRTNISDVTGMPVGRKISCVAADFDKGIIFVGCKDDNQVFVFNKSLKYIRTMTLLADTKCPDDMTFLNGNLLVCDSSGKAYAVKEKKSRAIYELPTPTLDGVDWRPRCACTDSSGFIYTLWYKPVSEGRVLTHHSRNGMQLLRTVKVVGTANYLSTLMTDSGEKLILCTREGMVHMYGLVH